MAWVAGYFGAVSNAWRDATPDSGETPGARSGSDSPRENPASAVAGDVLTCPDRASELSQVRFGLRFSCGFLSHRSSTFSGTLMIGSMPAFTRSPVSATPALVRTRTLDDINHPIFFLPQQTRHLPQQTRHRDFSFSVSGSIRSTVLAALECACFARLLADPTAANKRDETMSRTGNEKRGETRKRRWVKRRKCCRGIPFLPSGNSPLGVRRVRRHRSAKGL